MSVWRAKTWPGACAAAILVLAYLLIWWNRFTGLSDGVFLMHGQQVLAGRIPYRDFYLPIPPLTVLKTALVEKIFGFYLLAPRAVGVVERTCLAAGLFWWLASLFRKNTALLATVVSMIVFCGDDADPLSSYHADSVYLSVAAGICASILVRESGRRKALAAWLCGLFCGLALMTKQTTGVGVTLTLFAVILLCYSGKPKLVLIAAFFAVGWVLPVAAVSWWLWANGALSSAVQTIFGKGTGSKGPLWSVLSRPLTIPIADGMYREPCIAAILLLVAAWLIVSNRRYAKPLAWICAAVAAFETGRHFLPNAEPLATYLGLFGSLAISAYYLFERLRGPLDEMQKQFWILSATSFAVSYMLSLSWAAYQPMAIPSLAFLICFTSARVGPGLRQGITVGAITLAIVAIMLKVSLPYAWVSWTEPPITNATHVSSLPELRGLRLSPVAIATTEQATSAIQSACAPGEQLFAYPYLPLLHVLSHRPPATYSYLPWFDVTPDYVAESDALRLVEDPPCAIAYLALSSKTIETDELLFRSKADSGQRKLVTAMTSFEKAYKILYAQDLPGGTRLTIYARGSR
jgi:hypothetical protein